MKRMIALFMALCIVVFSMPMSALAASNSRTIYKCSVKAKFVTTTESGNIMSMYNDISLQLCNGVVMADIEGLCSNLDFICNRMDHSETLSKISILEKIPLNDYGKKYINELRKTLRTDGAIVKKSEWSESAAILFRGDSSKVLFGSALFGALELKLPEAPYVSDGRLYVPLDAFLYLLGCEYYVNEFHELVIKEGTLTLNDIANSKEVVSGDVYFDPVSEINFVNIKGEQMAGRMLKMFDGMFSFKFIDCWSYISNESYSEIIGEALALSLCVSDVDEMNIKYDYVEQLSELEDEYGVFEYALSRIDSSKFVGEEVPTIEEIYEMLQTGSDDIADILYRNHAIVEYYVMVSKQKSDAYLSGTGDMVFDLTGTGYATFMESADGFYDLINEVGLTEDSMSGMKLVKAMSVIAEFGNIATKYAKVNPHTTSSLMDFFSTEEAKKICKECIGDTFVKALNDEINACYRSQDNAGGVVFEKFMEYLKKEAKNEALSQLLEFGAFAVYGKIGDFAVDGIQFAWNVAKLNGMQSALNAADDLMVSVYSIVPQTSAQYIFHSYISNLQNGKSEDMQDVTNSLVAYLKSAYVSRTYIVKYLEWLADEQKRSDYDSYESYIDTINYVKDYADAISESGDQIVEYIAALEYNSSGFSKDGYKQVLEKQDSYNRYLVKNLFGDEIYNAVFGSDFPTSIQELPNGTLSGKICKASDRYTEIPGAQIDVYFDGAKIASVTTDESGNYSVELPATRYMIIIHADGYIDFSCYASVVAENTTYMETFLMIEGDTSLRGTASGTVHNSLSGVGASGVSLEFRHYWNNTFDEAESVDTTVTDGNGDYSIELPYGNYTVKATKNGYSTSYFNIIVQEGVTSNQNGTITPEISGDSYLITLTWDENPHDLDSHVFGTNEDGSSFHVFFSDMDAYYDGMNVCNLDYDDTSSYGPEHITLVASSDEPYYYYVHHYAGYGSIASSGAKVTVEQGNVLLAEFNAPTNLGNEIYWNVFAIKDGEIIVSNTISSEAEIHYAD